MDESAVHVLRRYRDAKIVSNPQAPADAADRLLRDLRAVAEQAGYTCAGESTELTVKLANRPHSPEAVVAYLGVQDGGAPFVVRAGGPVLPVDLYFDFVADKFRSEAPDEEIVPEPGMEYPTKSAVRVLAEKVVEALKGPEDQSASRG